MKYAFFLGLTVAGCGAVQQVGIGHTAEPLALARLTRSLVGIDTRFVVYTPQARRVSIIDPATETEVSGEDAPEGVTTALPIARLDGVALLGDRFLTIRSGGQDLTFTLPAYHAWDAAEDAAAFVFAGDAGLHVVRHSDAAGWQEIDVPVSGGATSRALIATDGATTVALDPASGAAVVEDAAGQRNCAGNGALTAAVLDGTKLSVGHESGEIYTYDTATCVPQGQPFTVGEGAPITRLALGGEGRLTVAQRGGMVSQVVRDGGAVVSSSATGCEFPLSPRVLPIYGTAFLCLSGVHADDAGALSYRSASLQVVDPAASPTPYVRQPVALSALAGIGLAPAAGKALALANGALGSLTDIELANGHSHERKGLFTKGILAK
jgi:hypothetical protein